MSFMIGTDEAGYGPNLGPLVITATCWSSADSLEDWDDWQDRFSNALSEANLASLANETVADALQIADSKALYKPKGSIRRLELPVLAFAMACGYATRTVDELWEQLSPADYPYLESEHWWDESLENWPLECNAGEIEQLSEAFQELLDRAGIQCRSISTATMVPNQFNDSLRRGENKASVLTTATLSQIKLAIDQVIAEQDAGSRGMILCDRHGGRARYRDALQLVFPDDLVQIYRESPECSEYRWRYNNKQMNCRFQVGGEEHPPVGLASMTSKYLREIAMKRFNAFWQKRVPTLKPTAGYPVDAKRFRADVSHVVQQLQINEDAFWRQR